MTAGVVDGGGTFEGVVAGNEGEAAACAGTITDFTIGVVHLAGNSTVVATPPSAKIFRICRRSCSLLTPRPPGHSATDKLDYYENSIPYITNLTHHPPFINA